jgi:ABC-type uncharacterized transport system fused permease/ATPase subunit
VNLEYIFDRIGSDWGLIKEWGTVLSPGEQQRIGVARLIYHKPSFAILDECTSSLDLKNEKLIYETINQSSITFLSVGHRDSIQRFHQNLLLLDGKKGWKLFERESK